MFTPQTLLTRVLTVTAVPVLALAVALAVITGVSGSDTDTAAPDLTPQRASVASTIEVVDPVASIEIGPEEAGMSFEPFSGEVVLSAYTELSPDAWLAGVLAGFAPEPTPAPAAPAAVPAAATPTPVAPAVEAPVESPVAPAVEAPVESPVEATDDLATAADPADLAVHAAPFGDPVPSPSNEPDPIAVTMAGSGWAALRSCESGNHGLYAANTGNGFYGAYQFTINTWNAVGQSLGMHQYVGVRPDLAPPAIQDRFAHALRYEISWGGWQHWPICGRNVA